MFCGAVGTLQNFAVWIQDKIDAGCDFALGVGLVQAAEGPSACRAAAERAGGGYAGAAGKVVRRARIIKKAVYFMQQAPVGTGAFCVSR